MTVPITQIDETVVSYLQWFQKTNEVVNAIATQVVTANALSTGSMTTGNAFVVGYFGANNLIASEALRGGTIDTSAVLTITSNVSVSGDTVTVGNVVINSTGISIDGIPVTAGVSAFASDIDGVLAAEIDSFDKALYSSIDYTLTVKDRSSNSWHFSKLSLGHDTGVVYYNEYASHYSNSSTGTLGSLGSFSANANSTHIRVYIVPLVANTRISGSKVEVLV